MRKRIIKAKDMEWWEEVFDESYGEHFLEPFEDKAEEEVDFIVDILNPTKNAKILDLCCGLGRHSLRLAERGYKITGVDFSRKYLEIAKERAKKKNLNVDFIQGDMKAIKFRREFNAVINMFTSFGFFEKDEENLMVLKNVLNALKPGGKFLIDVINRDWIVRHYKERDWREIKGGFFLENRKFDIARSINYAKWIVIRNGDRIEKNISLRLYSFHELKSMLESVGLMVIDTYGGFKKEEFTFDSFHMIILSEKSPKK